MKWRQKITIFFLIMIMTYLGIIYIHFEYISHSNIHEREEELQATKEQLEILKSQVRKLNLEKNQNPPYENTLEEISIYKSLSGRELLNPWQDHNVSKTPRILNEADKFRNREPVNVLLWAGGGGSFNGVGGNHFNSYLGHEVKQVDCGIPCYAYHDTNQLDKADAVVFEAQPFASYTNNFVQNPPEFPQRFPDQIFVNTGYEQPHYFHLYAHPGFLVHQEINMTYVQTDQVPISFHCLWSGTTKEDLLQPPPPKSKLIAWFGTNCHGSAGHEQRANWVREFMKHIKLDSYGKCLHNTDVPPEMNFPIYSNHGQSMKNKIILFRDYKFALIPENFNWTDYVTEKIMNAFQAGTVPVYMGSETVDDWSPGPKSVIKVSDFRDQKELADYLLYLDKNDDKYYEYFEWKKKGLSDKFVQKIDNCMFYASGCRLCQKVEEYRQVRREQKKTEGPFNDETLKFRKGHAIQLDGKSYVEVPHHESLDISNQYTLAAWVYPTQATPMRVIDKNTAGTIDGFNFDLMPADEDRLNPRLCGPGKCYLSQESIPINRWSFIAVVVSEQTVKIYVNSLLRLKEPTHELTRTNNHPLRFGRTAVGDGNYFFGNLDDISIWNRVLSRTEIRRLSFQILQGNERGLIGFWSFNEGKRNIANDYTIEKKTANFVGSITHIPSISKPLILPNAKKRWWDPLDQFIPNI